MISGGWGHEGRSGWGGECGGEDDERSGGGGGEGRLTTEEISAGSGRPRREIGVGVYAGRA